MSRRWTVVGVGLAVLMCAGMAPKQKAWKTATIGLKEAALDGRVVVVQYSLGLRGAAIESIGSIPIGWVVSIENGTHPTSRWSTVCKAGAETAGNGLHSGDLRRIATLRRYPSDSPVDLEVELELEVVEDLEKWTTRTLKLDLSALDFRTE